MGFTFHACLLMVQTVWKPIGDDPALFYVISAAWGVCNAIWEMLNFSKSQNVASLCVLGLFSVSSLRSNITSTVVLFLPLLSNVI